MIGSFGRADLSIRLQPGGSSRTPAIPVEMPWAAGEES